MAITAHDPLFGNAREVTRPRSRPQSTPPDDHAEDFHTGSRPRWPWSQAPSDAPRRPWREWRGEISKLVRMARCGYSAKIAIRRGNRNSAPPRPIRPPRIATAAPALAAASGRRIGYRRSLAIMRTSYVESVQNTTPSEDGIPPHGAIHGGLSRRVHDDGDAGEADEPADEVVAIGWRAVSAPTPRRAIGRRTSPRTPRTPGRSERSARSG